MTECFVFLFVYCCFPLLGCELQDVVLVFLLPATE